MVEELQLCLLGDDRTCFCMGDKAPPSLVPSLFYARRGEKIFPSNRLGTRLGTTIDLALKS